MDGTDSDEESSKDFIIEGKVISVDGPVSKPEETQKINMKADKVTKVKPKNKRSLKQRAKELEEMKEQIEAESSSSDSSDSSSSSSSSSSKTSVKQIPNNFPGLKITQPKPQINVKPPAQAYLDNKRKAKVPANQVNLHTKTHPKPSNTPYLDQFNVLPKSKLSNQAKESIIHNHLNQIQPDRKPILKGTKITPDHYAPAPKRSKRRDSHGNRAFGKVHKMAREQREKLQREYRQKGYILVTNSNQEDILCDFNSNFTRKLSNKGLGVYVGFI